MKGSPRAWTALLAIALGAILVTSVAIDAQQKTANAPATTTAKAPTKESAKVAALSSLDYIQIQQLARRFAWALDTGDDYGYAFADLFTPDASFVDTSDGPSGRTYQGRDALAALARANQRGPVNLNHFGMNHLVAPTADGVVGKAYVVIVDVGVSGTPNRVSRGGHYDDVYEKTGLGWRFKTRTFVASVTGTPAPPAAPPVGNR